MLQAKVQEGYCLKLLNNIIVTYNKDKIIMYLKRVTKGCMAIVPIIGITFSVLSFTTLESSATALSVSTRKFVKTKNRCSHSNCSCSGYWGYKHDNGTYEGVCSNTDGHGHTCGHGPEKHGLKKW